VDAGPNPSFLAIHPNRRVLYAVNELEHYKGRPTGAVSALAIEEAPARSLDAASSRRKVVRPAS